MFCDKAVETPIWIFSDEAASITVIHHDHAINYSRRLKPLPLEKTTPHKDRFSFELPLTIVL